MSTRHMVECCPFDEMRARLLKIVCQLTAGALADMLMFVVLSVANMFQAELVISRLITVQHSLRASVS